MPGEGLSPARQPHRSHAPSRAVQIVFGWIVGISRFINNKHNIGDIIGGFMLGAMIGLVFVLRVRTPQGQPSFAIRFVAVNIGLRQMAHQG